jgi:hypothetical protein
MFYTSSRNLPPIAPPILTTFPTCALSITVVLCAAWEAPYSAYTPNHLLPKTSICAYGTPLRIGPDGPEWLTCNTNNLIRASAYPVYVFEVSQVADLCHTPRPT